MRQSTLAGHGKKEAAIQTIAIPSPSARAVIINIPGYKGDIHGFNGKYDKIGAMLAARGVGAFVEMPNRLHLFDNDPKSIIDDLAVVITSVSHETRELCAAEHADIYLMGTSVGGAAVAAVAGRFAQVKKILLVAPALPPEPGTQAIVYKSIAGFAGEISVVVGDKDTVTGSEDASFYADVALNAKHRRFEVIPDCDHQFTGETNGMILSKAPLWAFAGEMTFPSPEGGLKLY